MKQLIRYLVPLVIGGAVLIYLDVWSRSITPIEDPDLKDAPVAPDVARIPTTPAPKSGYQFPLALPPTTPAGPSHFTTTGEPPKVSVLPKSPLYYGACGPNLLHVTFALGAQNAAKHVQGIDVVLHFLDDHGMEFAKSSSPMTAVGGGEFPWPNLLEPTEYDALLSFLTPYPDMPHSQPALSGFEVPNVIIPAFDLGANSLPSKIAFSFVLHFDGSPDEEFFWQLSDSGDQVLVGFEPGEIHRPVVITVYPCPPEPPATPTPREKSEKEPEGAACYRRACP